MLGREKRNKTTKMLVKEEEESESIESYYSEVSLNGLKRTKNEEDDDDSPYFVKINIDSLFLSYLEEPSLTDGNDVPQHFEVLINNKVFKEIVYNEIFMMFGAQKAPLEKSKTHLVKQNVTILNDEES